MNRTCSLCSVPDDTPVASAKAAPADGVGDADDEGNANGRLWRTVLIGEQEHRIDMQIIRPYLRVITHGGQSATGTIIRKCGRFVSAVIWTLFRNLVPSGYYGEGLNAIIVFSACYLPDSSCSDYHYIMENLFLWVCHGWLHSLERAQANVFPSAATWSAAWRCWWLKITWSSTWTEPLLAARCPESAGSRSVTKWLTEGGGKKSSNGSIKHLNF